MRILVRCLKCRHYLGRDNEKAKSICFAYPYGIPEDIIWREVEHDKVLQGQKGKYVFEEKDES